MILPKNGGLAIPPVGHCAVCHRGLGVYGNRVLLEFETFRAGGGGERFAVHACSSLHMAEAMRRLAQLVEEKEFPVIGSTDWARKHGVMVTQ